MNNKKGITSYKHLNKIIMETLKNSDKKMSASQINDYICTNFKTSKIKISSKSIGKRVVLIPQISSEYNSKGIYYYKYDNTINE